MKTFVFIILVVSVLACTNYLQGTGEEFNALCQQIFDISLNEINEVF